MSSDNVDVLRRIVEAADRQDYRAVLADLHPEIEIRRWLPGDTGRSTSSDSESDDD